MPAVVSQAAVGPPEKGPMLLSGKTGSLRGPDKYRVLVGWNHQDDDVESLKDGRIFGLVSDHDHFEVYATSSNRGRKGEVVFCGRVNFSMLLMIHPWFALDGRAPMDGDPDDKRRVREKYRELVRHENEQRGSWERTGEGIAAEEKHDDGVSADDESMFFPEHENLDRQDRDPSPDGLPTIEEILTPPTADKAKVRKHAGLLTNDHDRTDGADRQNHDPGFARDDNAVLALAEDDIVFVKKEPRFVPGSHVDLTVRHEIDLTDVTDNQDMDDVVFVKEEIHIKDEDMKIFTSTLQSSTTSLVNPD